MRARVATSILVSLGILFAAALPASAQAPAATVPVECEIDLSVFQGLAEDFAGSSYVADAAELFCPGSSPGGVLKLQCVEQLVGWTGGKLTTKDNFRCELSDEECPGITTPSIADADNRTLTIYADGLVELSCQRNVVQ